MPNNYFFVGPDGMVMENPAVLPLEAIRPRYPDGALVFRFAFDQPNNTLYVQDPSFRRKMEDGDDDAWDIVNQALGALEKKTGKRSPRRIFGDPQNSAVMRQLSDYPSAWRRLKHALVEELGVPPVDIPVYEYVPFPGKEDETVFLLPRGSKLGDRVSDGPTLGLNRMMHKAMGDEAQGEDVDWSLLQDALAYYYLRNLADIMKEASPAGDAILEAIKTEEEDCPLMFAMDAEGGTRTFKAKGDARDEDSIRTRLPDYDGPIVLFRFDPERGLVTVTNHLLTPMYEDETGRRMAKDIVDLVCRKTGKKKENVCMAFEPALGRPWLTRMSRIEPLWTALGGGEDMDVLEAPFSPGGEDGLLIREPGDEPERLRAYRASRGLDAQFPLAAVDNRLSWGKRLGILARLHEELTGRKPGPDDLRSLLRLPEERREQIQKRMILMLEIGMSPSDVLDFYSDRLSLPERVAYREIMDEALAEACPKKVAMASLPLQVNQWWWPSVQEGLKHRAENDGEEDDAPEALNQPEAGGPPVKPSIEVLLERDRKPLQSQKPTELQLRQNRI